MSRSGWVDSCLIELSGLRLVHSTSTGQMKGVVDATIVIAVPSLRVMLRGFSSSSLSIGSFDSKVWMAFCFVLRLGSSSSELILSVMYVVVEAVSNIAVTLTERFGSSGDVIWTSLHSIGAVVG